MPRGDKRYPRQERMQYKWEFDQVKKQGRSFSGKLIVLSILKHKLNGRRIGYIITKRIGPAVIRNKIRRRLREIYRTHHLSLKSGISIVIIARPSASNASYQEFDTEFLNLYHLAHSSLWDST